MDAELAVAGLGRFVLALGHATTGLRWVLPNLTKERPAGHAARPTLDDRGMLRCTWHVVSVVLVGFAVLLTALAVAPDADPRTLLLRWSAALWLAATALACWEARRRPRSLPRLPVPLVTAVIAVVC